MIARREFITLLGGAAVSWPLAARAQQSERMRRIGVLMNLPSDNSEGMARLAAFLQGLQELGWTVGRNVQIDYRWGSPDADRIRKDAAELLVLAPDVILSSATPTVGALQQATRTVPIVFALVADPVGAGFVETLARPGGHMTGFAAAMGSLAGKWLGLLKEAVPNLSRVGILSNSAVSAGAGEFYRAPFQVAAAALGITGVSIELPVPEAIEPAIAAFAAAGGNGIVGESNSFNAVNYQRIITAVNARRLPSIFPLAFYPHAGALASYGVDTKRQWLGAAEYIDRILRGEQPGNLPVQQPAKFELVVNMKTAKAIGLEVPPTLLARADEVIE
jgi:putative ABC transport system substrate-binding protein